MSIKKFLTIFLLAIFVGSGLMFVSCSKKEKTVGGALVGGALGAGVGGAASGDAAGAVLGGVGGAVLGGVIGHSMGDDKK